MFPFKALTEANLEGKTVVLRVDFNSPIDVGNGAAKPDLKGTARIDDHIENTIIPLFDLPVPPRNVVLLTHQGRHGRPDCTTLRPHFEYCRSKLKDKDIKTFYIWEELTDNEVFQLGEKAVASEEVLDRIRRLRRRTVLLLENVRLSQEEEETIGESPNDFAHNPLISILEKVENRIVALDGFSVAHRGQSSVLGLASLGELYPSVA